MRTYRWLLERRGVRRMNEIGELKKMYLDILVEKAITSLAKLIKGLIPRTYSQVHI